RAGYRLGDAVRLHALPDKSGVVALRMNEGVQRLPDPATLPEDSLLASPEEGSMGQIPPDPATRRPGCAWAVFSQGPFRTKSGILYGITRDRPDSLVRWDGRAWTWRGFKEHFGVSGTPFRDMVGNLWLMEGLDGKGEVRLARFVPEEDRFDADSVEGWAGRLEKYWLVFEGYYRQAVPFLPTACLDGRVLQMTPSEIRLYDKGKKSAWPGAELMKTALAAKGREGEPVPEVFPKDAHFIFNENGDALFFMPDAMPLIFQDGVWAVPKSSDYETFMPGIGRRSPNFDRDEGGAEIPATVEGLEMADGRVWRTVGEERRDIFEGIPLPSLGVWPNSRVQAVTCAGGYPCFLLPNALLVVLEQGQAQPVITPEVVAGNRVALHAANQPPDTALYWRVSGDWKPCAGPGNETDPLPNGAHTIQCRFVDAALNPGPLIEVKAEVRAGRAEVEGWAEALVGGTPEEKEAARASLAAMGAEVFPLLVELAGLATPEKALHFRWAALRLNADFVTLPNSPPPDTLPESGDGDPAKVDWSLTPLQRDAHGYVWALLEDEDSGPQGWMWTGGRWLHVFTIPKRLSNRYGLALDSRDQVWIAWGQPQGSVMVGEPLGANRLGEMAWKEYTSLEQALDARFDDKTTFAPEPAGSQPEHGLNRVDWGFNRVLRLPDGGLAFHDSERVAARLGGKWRAWDMKQLVAPEDNRLPQLLMWGVTASGQLELGAYKKCVRLEPGPEPAWKEAPIAESVDAVVCASREAIGGAPEGVPELAGEPPAERVFSDIPCPGGVSWRYTRIGLLRKGYGLWRVIAPLEALPDPGGHGLEDIQTSPCGTVFFSSLGKGGSAWNLRAVPGLDLHPQAPETRAELTAAGDGTLNLRFTAGAGEGKVYHTWRVDGGPWQCATDAAETVVGPLSPGPHRVEVRALSEWVVPDPSPLVLEAEVVLSGDMVDQWLQDLAGKDITARDRAARALLALGPEILPRLEALRGTVRDGDTGWWMDTLIERLKKGASGESAPPPAP
ncbi:MAG TPA: hypothetical protein P5069_01980, partial [Candidatus Hydrogenedentes bacterium]|nr:hypothetical protein [Candidatus Hydrogenedentota bacterium]